jgi:hypothetical protein
MKIATITARYAELQAVMTAMYGMMLHWNHLYMYSLICATLFAAQSLTVVYGKQ